MAKENIDIKSKLMKKNKDQEKKELEFISDIKDSKTAFLMEELLADNTQEIKEEKQTATIATAGEWKNALDNEILTESSILDKYQNKNIKINISKFEDNIKTAITNREVELLKEINQLKYKNVKATISTSYEVIKLEEKLKNLYESSGSISKFNRSLIYRKGLEAAVKEIEQEIKLEKESWS